MTEMAHGDVWRQVCVRERASDSKSESERGGGGLRGVRERMRKKETRKEKEKQREREREREKKNESCILIHTHFLISALNFSLSLRPRMEKLHSERHELSFCGLVSILIVLIVPPRLKLLFLLVQIS